MLQEKLRVAALRQDECEARLLIQDQQNQRMLQEYQVCGTPEALPESADPCVKVEGECVCFRLDWRTQRAD